MNQKNNRLLLLAFIATFILLGVIVYLSFFKTSNSSTDSTGGQHDTSYYDENSKQRVYITPDRTPQGDSKDDEPSSLLGVEKLTSTCGMTMYNIRALQKAIAQYDAFKNTIISITVDKVEITTDADSSIGTTDGTVQCRFPVIVNGETYMMHDVFTDPASANLIITKDGARVFSSGQVVGN